MVVPEKCENQIKGTPSIMFIFEDEEKNTKCVKYLSSNPKDNSYKITSTDNPSAGFMLTPKENED